MWPQVFGDQNYEIKKGGHRTCFPSIQANIRLNFFFRIWGGLEAWLARRNYCFLFNFLACFWKESVGWLSYTLRFLHKIPNFKMAACFSNQTFERAFGLATFFLTSGFFKFWLRKRKICKHYFHYKKSIGHRLRFHTSQFFPTLPPFSNKEKRV